MIGRGSPYFGGMPVPSTVDSQVSPYGPRNLEVTRIRVEVAASAPTNGAKAMSRRNSLISRLRHRRAWDEWDEKGDGEEAAAAPASAGTRPRSRRRRVVVAVTFASLFVAGAAFSAAAGDEVRSTLEATAASGAAASDGATADATTPDATTTDGTTTDGTTTDGTAPAVTDPGAVPTPAADSDSSPA